MKICIINPPAEKIVEPYYDRPAFPRPALAFLAGHLKSALPNIDVHVKDAKYDRLNFKETIEYIKENNFDLIGITAMTNEIDVAGELASSIKKLNSKIITVIGGVHVTALPEETLKEFPDFDYGVIGEGEVIFCELLKELQTKKFPEVAGVVFRKDNKIIQVHGGKPLDDQDSLRPAWDMFKPAKEYMLQTSRGCPYSCNFCMNPGGRIVRARSVETTVNEIEYLVDVMGAKEIYFGDEIFTVKRDRVMQILKEIINKGLHKKMKWRCMTHVNTLDEELVRLMKESNCYLVGLGIETGDEDTFKQMGKGVNKNKILKTIKTLKKVGLNFETMFILGQPNETLESAKNTINFATELNPTSPVFGLMVPYPGTKIGQMAFHGEGGYKVISKDWKSFNKQVGDALELEGISRRQLERIQLWGYFKVFLYNFRFLDLAKFCFKYRHIGLEVFKRAFLNMRQA